MATPPLQWRAAPRVMMVTGALDCGGAQRIMTDMANYWVARGWHVTLATWSGPEIRDFYALDRGVERVWLDVTAGRGGLVTTARAVVARILKLRRMLQISRPDAVLSFIDVSNVHTILAALGLGLRVVVSERTSAGARHAVPQPWSALRRLCYPRAAEVVAQTRDAARWIDAKFRAHAAVISNALRPLPEITGAREPLIVAVGRLSPDKGFDLLLRAFARIRGDFSAWQLRIIGEGPERSALVALREELQLVDRVEFVGESHSIEVWLARAGVVVHPSRREGFPNSVLEAMGMGAAVVCANCQSGPAELIEGGVNGLLVPVDDIAALADAMSEVMARPDLRRQLGQEASKVRQRFAQDIIMPQWERCLVPAHARETSRGQA